MAMDAPNPLSVIDLGAGAGDLAIAARRRWEHASIVTVDIAEEGMLKHGPLLSIGGGFHKHIRADALNIDLSTILKEEYGAFEAAICNPPYVRSQWRKEYAEILEEANIFIEDKHQTEVGAEVIFIAQNLRLTADGGHVGVIVPDGIITGERQRRLRKSLVENNRLHCAITLPNGAFSHTEARAHILILSKGQGSAGAIRLQQVSRDGNLTAPLFISSENAIERLDYGYHLQKRQAMSTHGKSLGHLSPKITRGSLSSSELKNAPFPVFHTTSFPVDADEQGFAAPPELRLPTSLHDNPNLIVASPGDLIVARVDRNLSRKVCLLTAGHVALSDCVFRVRIAPQYVAPLYKAMRAQSGQIWLAAAARGVGAKYLTTSSLLAFPIPFNE
jgi:type I restriction enzyme M protein